jgi:hypothetical protein
MRILSKFKRRQLLAPSASGECLFTINQTKHLSSNGSGHFCGFPATNYSLAFLDAITGQVEVRIS